MSTCKEKSLLKVTANQGKLFRERECIASNISKIKNHAEHFHIMIQNNHFKSVVNSYTQISEVKEI